MVNFLSKAQITCVNWLQENFNNQFLWLLNKSNIDKCLLHWRIMSNFAAIFRITIIMRKHLSAILYIAILLVIAFLGITYSTCRSTTHRRMTTIVTGWRTVLGASESGIANYEGMCLGPKLPDGRQVIILCADSQDRYMGVLHDWFRTIVL